MRKRRRRRHTPEGREHRRLAEHGELHHRLRGERDDESRAVVGPFYERLAAAIREIDAEHILFFDGNTYSTEFDFFGEPLENAVYTLHDYVLAGLGRADHYPGSESAEEKFLER
jgi:endoglucanase